jgi:hypothetical protein
LNDRLFAEQVSYSVTESGELEEMDNHIPVSLGTMQYVDIDNDGDLDFLQPSYTINNSVEQVSSAAKFHLNEGNGVFTPVLENALFSNGVTFAHLNNDGLIDAFIANGGQIFLNQGGTEFIYGQQIMTTNYGMCIAEDIDNDGDVDIIARLTLPIFEQKIVFYINDGDANFELDESLTFIPDVGDLELMKTADLDNDGDFDLLLKQEGSGFKVLLNEDLSFVISDEFYLDYGVVIRMISIADLDGDGDLDIFCSGNSNHDGCQVHTLYNDGDGNFTELNSQQFENACIYSLWIDDLEGDGDLDIFYSGRDKRDRIKSWLYRNNTNTLSTNHTEELMLEMVLYPNPTTGRIQIRSSSSIEGMAIYNAQGQIIEQLNPIKTATELTVELNIPPGVYFVRAAFTNGIETSKKLVIVE